jgi:hypothetical protein
MKKAVTIMTEMAITTGLTNRVRSIQVNLQRRPAIREESHTFGGGLRRPRRNLPPKTGANSGKSRKSHFFPGCWHSTNIPIAVPSFGQASPVQEQIMGVSFLARAALAVCVATAAAADSTYEVEFEVQLKKGETGTFVLEVHPEWAPLGAARFKELVDAVRCVRLRFNYCCGLQEHVPGRNAQW